MRLFLCVLCTSVLVLSAAGPLLAIDSRPAVFLEVTDEDPDCDRNFGTGTGVNTSIDLPERASVYTVYLLGKPDGYIPVGQQPPPVGLTGFQMGIEYTENTAFDVGMKVLSWNYCTLLEFPQSHWPDNASGNTITWSRETCVQKSVVVGGYFVVAVYGASTMGITPYSATGQVKVANCDGAERVVEVDVDSVRQGWVSIGGGKRGDSASGCNPMIQYCTDITAVDHVSWGRIKTLLD